MAEDEKLTAPRKDTKMVFMREPSYETPDAVRVRAMEPSATCHYRCETLGYQIWVEAGPARARRLADGNTPAEAWHNALASLTQPDTPVA